MKKYPSVPDDCKQIYASVIGEDAEAVNAAIDQGGYSMDALSVGILLESITVTQKYNLVFRFIDGSTFIKRFGLITPKGKYGAYSRPERKQKIIALHEAGMKPVDIAAEVGGTVGAIRMVLRRHKDHLSHT